MFVFKNCIIDIKNMGIILLEFSEFMLSNDIQIVDKICKNFTFKCISIYYPISVYLNVRVVNTCEMVIDYKMKDLCSRQPSYSYLY